MVENYLPLNLAKLSGLLVLRLQKWWNRLYAKIVNDVSFSNDGKLLFCAVEDEIKIVKIDNEGYGCSNSTGNQKVNNIYFSDDESKIAAVIGAKVAILDT